MNLDANAPSNLRSCQKCGMARKGGRFALIRIHNTLGTFSCPRRSGLVSSPLTFAGCLLHLFRKLLFGFNSQAEDCHYDETHSCLPKNG